MTLESEASPMSPARSIRHRWKSTTEEDEVMRERLTIARVLNGFSLEEAQERLNIPDINLARIELGKDRFPTGRQFIYTAAVAYSVSTDFLYGLTSDPDLHSAHYALLRGFEDILRRQVEATGKAFSNYVISQAKSRRSSFAGVVESIDGVRRAVEIMREKYGFDEVRGSSAVLAALERAERAVDPLKRSVHAQIEIERLSKDMALGKTGPLAFLLDEKNGVILEP